MQEVKKPYVICREKEEKMAFHQTGHTLKAVKTIFTCRSKNRRCGCSIPKQSTIYACTHWSFHLTF